MNKSSTDNAVLMGTPVLSTVWNDGTDVCKPVSAPLLGDQEGLVAEHFE